MTYYGRRVIEDDLWVEQLSDELAELPHPHMRFKYARQPFPSAWTPETGFITDAEHPITDDEQPETVEEEARRLVTHDRNKAYDHPYIDFTRVGRIWGAILGVDDISPEKVCLLLEGLKLSRQSHIGKRDNVVDGIGYWLCYDLIEKYRDGQR